jgi:hypothetical protein
MAATHTAQGLATVIYPVGELQRARDWYAAAFQQQPYFDQPFYVGFNVAGYELGLMPQEGGTASSASAAGRGAGGVAYWRFASLDDAHRHFIDAGAVAVSAPQDVGEGSRWRLSPTRSATPSA